MLQFNNTLRLIVLTAVCGGLAAEFARAQAPATRRQPAAPAAAAPSAAKSADAALKAQILASDRWRNVEQEFHKWLSVQVVYTPQQVAQMKQKLAAEVRKMSAAELQQFLDQWDARLKALLGSDATEARDWLGQYMSTMASGYRKKFLQSLGPADITKMTPAQIEQRANEIRADRLSIQQQQAASSSMRQQMVQSTMQATAAQQQAIANQMSTAASYRSYQSPYSPGTPAQDMFSEYDPQGLQQSYYMDATTGQFYYSIP